MTRTRKDRSIAIDFEHHPSGSTTFYGSRREYEREQRLLTLRLRREAAAKGSGLFPGPPLTEEEEAEYARLIAEQEAERRRDTGVPW